MRAVLRRSATIATAAVAAALALGGPVAANDGDAIGRLIAEQFAKDGRQGLPAGAVRKVVPAAAPAAADELRLIEEIEMLERARAEAEARRDALVRARETAERGDRKDADKADKAADEQRLAEQRRAAEEAERAVEAARKAEAAAIARMEAEREAEAKRIDDALRAAREARAQRPREDAAHDAHAAAGDNERRHVRIDQTPGARDRRDVVEGPAPLQQPRHHDGASALGGPDPRTDSAGARVTVLLTMLPGYRGIRRHHRTGDPILCGEPGCYVSAGAEAPADLMPLRRAFGFRRTMGERAGACSDSLGCVFRDIDLGAFPAILQPVDMRLLKHDRRMPQVLHEASDCHLSSGRLSCTAIHGPDYTMWVVPEAVARAAGPATLERAIEDGLDGPGPRVFVRN